MKVTRIVELKERAAQFRGLDCGLKTEIVLPTAVPKVWLLAHAAVSEPGRVEAFNEDNSSAGTAEMTQGPCPLELTGTALKRIVINAPKDQVLLLQLCFGQPGYQAGIAAFYILPGRKEIPGLSTEAQGSIWAIEPSVIIHDNLAACPRGQAIVAIGQGQMSVSENAFASQGERKQPPGSGGKAPSIWDYLVSQIAQAANCVFILDTGFTPGLADATMRYSFGTAAYSTYRETSTTINLPAIAFPFLWLDGRVLFHGNQVTLEVSDQAKELLPASVVLASLGDVALQDNQVVSRTGREMLADVITAAATLRVSNNRFTEVPNRSFISCLGYGIMNITTDNQGTHCILAGGTNVVDRDNQVMIATPFCPLLKERIAAGQLRRTTGEKR